MGPPSRPRCLVFVSRCACSRAVVVSVAGPVAREQGLFRQAFWLAPRLIPNYRLHLSEEYKQHMVKQHSRLPLPHPQFSLPSASSGKKGVFWTAFRYLSGCFFGPNICLTAFRSLFGCTGKKIPQPSDNGIFSTADCAFPDAATKIPPQFRVGIFSNASMNFRLDVCLHGEWFFSRRWNFS